VDKDDYSDNYYHSNNDGGSQSRNSFEDNSEGRPLGTTVQTFVQEFNDNYTPPIKFRSSGWLKDRSKMASTNAAATPNKRHCLTSNADLIIVIKEVGPRFRGSKVLCVHEVELSREVIGKNQYFNRVALSYTPILAKTRTKSRKTI
jgi:hypothetical protein